MIQPMRLLAVGTSYRAASKKHCNSGVEQENRKTSAGQ